jgi:hypothetical protein
MMQHDIIKRRICRLLGLTEEQYAEHQYYTGLNYLRLYIRHDDVVRRELEGHKLFWAWWRNQWAMRDAQFLRQATCLRDDKNYSSLWSVWLNSHDAAMLAAERYASAKLLGKSYAIMIGKVIKAEVAP